MSDSKQYVDVFDYTNKAKKHLYDVVNNDDFYENDDVKLIYKQLEEKITPIPFCDYLKRYIYKKAELKDNPEDIPLQEYVSIIRYSFMDNEVPAAFTPTTAKLSALAKNWLTQYSVQRNVVFLLGFGLKMKPEDVNSFLTNALRESMINPNSPFEVICCYCYENDLNYAQYKRLWDKFEKLSAAAYSDFILGENTVRNARIMTSISEEDSLMAYLSVLKSRETGEAHTSRSARQCFERLYNDARKLIADVCNEVNADTYNSKLKKYHEKLLMNDRIYDCDKIVKLEHYKSACRTVSYNDITPGDVERMLYSEVPYDRHGNLISSKFSTLYRHFTDKRFSRQHINSILSGSTSIDRFDLITLNFLIYALKVDEFPLVDKRYNSFVNSTNSILTGCNMGKLYEANPYENFILMCILSEYPLGTYNEVLGFSYENE